jgi:hypothetical protein
VKPRIRVKANSIFVSALPLAEKSGGLTLASCPPDGEAAADFLLPVSLNATPGDAPVPALYRLPAPGPDTNDDGIPTFLRRDANNIPAYARKS